MKKNDIKNSFRIEKTQYEKTYKVIDIEENDVVITITFSEKKSKEEVNCLIDKINQSLNE